MTDTTLCPHGMPSPRSCFDCMEEGPVAPVERWWQQGLPFIAAYPGTCVGCGDPFEVGDRIQRWDYGSQRTNYTHAACRP